MKTGNRNEEQAAKDRDGGTRQNIGDREMAERGCWRWIEAGRENNTR